MSENENNEINNKDVDKSSESEEVEVFDNATEQGEENFNKLIDEEDIKVDEKSSEEKKEIVSETKTEKISPSQLKKYEKLGAVKEKISKILQAPNIELVDENIGDEYELDDENDGKKQQQQDYDSLKALFGDSDKNKKNELTLTIDDFDYTYIGQYVDELDLMHVKNIKHIKLQRKHSKHLKRFIVAAVIIVAAGLAGLLTFLLLQKNPPVLQSVALNQTKNTYYVNQKFDYTGLYFIATYSDGSVKKIPLNSSYLLNDYIIGSVERENNEIKFTGGQSVDLTFSYNGFMVTYNVELKQKVLNSNLQAFYSDGLFNLKTDEFITSKQLMVFADYGNFGLEELKFSNDLAIFVDNTEMEYSANDNGFLLTKNITQTSRIRIEFESASIEFTYQSGVGLVGDR